MQITHLLVEMHNNLGICIIYLQCRHAYDPIFNQLPLTFAKKDNAKKFKQTIKGKHEQPKKETHYRNQ